MRKQSDEPINAAQDSATKNSFSYDVRLFLYLLVYGLINTTCVALAAKGIFGYRSIDLLWFFTFTAPIVSVVGVVAIQLMNLNKTLFGWASFGIVIVSFFAAAALNASFLLSAIAAV